MYASLPTEHAQAVRQIATDRGWSLLAVAATALTEYGPEQYKADRHAHGTSPLPGAKKASRHGDTYLPMSVNNAEQNQWLTDTLAPYDPESVADVLGRALSHYVQNAQEGRP